MDHIDWTSITGTVTDELTGAPLGGIEVTYLEESEDGWIEQPRDVTGPDGRYAIEVPTFMVIGDEWSGPTTDGGDELLRFRDPTGTYADVPDHFPNLVTNARRGPGGWISPCSMPPPARPASSGR